MFQAVFQMISDLHNRARSPPHYLPEAHMKDCFIAIKEEGSQHRTL
jgi:hypothetical protein